MTKNTLLSSANFNEKTFWSKGFLVALLHTKAFLKWISSKRNAYAGRQEYLSNLQLLTLFRFSSFFFSFFFSFFLFFFLLFFIVLLIIVYIFFFAFSGVISILHSIHTYIHTYIHTCMHAYIHVFISYTDGELIFDIQTSFIRQHFYTVRESINTCITCARNKMIQTNRCV